MSEHTSATWLMPPSSNSELRLCGLIIPGLPSLGMALGWFRGGDLNPNLTSVSGLFQRSAAPGIDGIPVTTKEARRCLRCPTRPPSVRRYPVKRRPPSTQPPGPSSRARAWPPSPTLPRRPAGRRLRSILLRLQRCSRPRVGAAVPRRGRRAAGYPAWPVDTGERPPGRSCTPAHLQTSADGDDQRVAAGDGQRRLPPLLC